MTQRTDFNQWLVVQNGNTHAFKSDGVATALGLNYTKNSWADDYDKDEATRVRKERDRRILEILENGEQIDFTPTDAFLGCWLDKSKTATIIPPEVHKMRELKAGLEERGFRKQRYDEVDGELSYTHTQLGVKVCCYRSGDNRSRTGFYVFTRKEGSYGRNHNDAKTTLGNETVEQFLTRIDTYKGQAPTDKGTPQNLILEECKKIWPFELVPKLKRGRDVTSYAELRLNDPFHILEADKSEEEKTCIRDAWLEGESPRDGDVVQTRFDFQILLSNEKLIIHTQLRLLVEINIDFNNPWCTPENIVAVAKKALESDYELFKSKIQRKLDHINQVDAINAEISKLLPTD